MSNVPLETCWAFNERWNNKFCYKVQSWWLFPLNQDIISFSLMVMQPHCDLISKYVYVLEVIHSTITLMLGRQTGHHQIYMMSRALRKNSYKNLYIYLNPHKNVRLWYVLFFVKLCTLYRPDDCMAWHAETSNPREVYFCWASLYFQYVYLNLLLFMLNKIFSWWMGNVFTLRYALCI